MKLSIPTTKHSVSIKLYMYYRRRPAQNNREHWCKRVKIKNVLSQPLSFPAAKMAAHSVFLVFCLPTFLSQSWSWPILGYCMRTAGERASGSQLERFVCLLRLLDVRQACWRMKDWMHCCGLSSLFHLLSCWEIEELAISKFLSLLCICLTVCHWHSETGLGGLE